MKFSMTLFTLVLGFLTSLAAQAVPVSGTLEKNAEGTYLTLVNTGERYRVVGTQGDATEGLRKLDTGDFITGGATLNTEAKLLTMESLDYVGLKKLLGVWYSGENMMNFSSFSNLSVYPLYPFDLPITPQVAPKADFRYSMAPLQGKQWAVFLSNRQATVFATIEFNSSTGDGKSDFATLRTYNVESGNADRTIRLVRWSN